MKIAMISEHASPLAVLGGVDAGGQNVHVAKLSAAIARRGHDVTVYTRRDNPDSPERVTTPRGYTVAHVPAGPSRQLPKDELLHYEGDFARYLDAQWAAERPDVAHAHFWMSGVAAQLAARGRQVPTVQTFHALGVDKCRQQGDQDASSGARLKLEKLVAKHATWIAATCTDELFELMRLRRSRARISVVPCGVDHTMFSTEGSVAQRGETPRIVAVGRLAPHKGFDTMIEALPAIPNAEYVIVGGPDAEQLDADPEVRRLRALAAELGVRDRVRFTGAVARDELPALLRSADVVTCTPWHEPRGLVPLEAMACGVAVVAYAVGGMPDIVCSRRHGTAGAAQTTAGLGRGCVECLAGFVPTPQSGAGRPGPGLRPLFVEPCGNEHSSNLRPPRRRADTPSAGSDRPRSAHLSVRLGRDRVMQAPLVVVGDPGTRRRAGHPLERYNARAIARGHE